MYSCYDFQSYLVPIDMPGIIHNLADMQVAEKFKEKGRVDEEIVQFVAELQKIIKLTGISAEVIRFESKSLLPHFIIP